MIYELPDDAWLHFLPFVTIADVASLMRTCTTVRRTLVSMEDIIWRLFAELTYPAETLLVQQYDNSWKDLLQDDNAKGGFYMLTSRTVSTWDYNVYQDDEHHHLDVHTRIYVNSIEHVIWDKQERTVSLVIEAFGHTDLRGAETTTIFQHVHPPGEFNSATFAPIASHYLINREGYKLCVVSYEQTIFESPSNITYYFTYNGSDSNAGSDYPCVEFLVNVASLKELFSLQNESVSFRSRSFFNGMEPSDVRSWSHQIPGRIIDSLMSRGQWGVSTPDYSSAAGFMG